MNAANPETPASVDVLVFGAGAGGMTAALVCALEGLDVLLCEKTDQVGGTTATSAGTIWVPGTQQARDIGSTDTIDDARRYLDAVVGPAPDNRREIYLTTGAHVVEYLERRSAVHANAPCAWRRRRSRAISQSVKRASGIVIATKRNAAVR